VAAVADDLHSEQILAELSAQLEQSRQQETALLDALTRVLALIDADRSP
jgi:hypothetical protein